MGAAFRSELRDQEETGRVHDWLAFLALSRVFACLSLFTLRLKVIWGITMACVASVAPIVMITERQTNIHI